MNLSRVLPHFLASLRAETVPATFSALESLSASEWDEFTQLAIAHRVAPLLYRRWQTERLPPALPTTAVERLERHYFHNALRNQCLLRELHQILQALHAAQIPVLVLKGAHLATTVYDEPSQRFMTDLDLLVRCEHSLAAYECLRQLKYESNSPFTPEPYLISKHHFPALCRAGAVAEVELHWNLTPPERAWSIQTEDLWRRAHPLDIAGTTALCLCPEDLLLHLCYHATHHHLSELFWHGMGTLCDVDRVIRHHCATLDWEAIVTRARAWGWRRGVYLQLTLAAELLGTPVPKQWLTSLYPVGCEETVYRAALAHLFIRKGAAHRLTSEMTRFFQEARLSDKMKYLRESLFPPPAEMAIRHQVSLATTRLWLSYPAHLLSLARRWTRKGWQYWRGTPPPRISEDQYRIMKWLEHR